MASPPSGGLRTGEVSATIGCTLHILPIYASIDGPGTVSGAHGQTMRDTPMGVSLARSGPSSPS